MSQTFLRFRRAARVWSLLLSLSLVGASCRRAPPQPKNEREQEAEVARRQEREFAMRCGPCHALGRSTLGPSLEEIAGLYSEDPDGIVRWAQAPGRKRTELAPMPSFRHLPEQDLRAIAEYMLKIGQR